MAHEIQQWHSPQDIDLMAQRVARSGLFPGIRNQESAFALMLLCQSEGLHPMQAVRRFHIIEGRPSMRADAMLAEFQRQGGKVQWGDRSDTSVSATFSHPSGGSCTVTWGVEDAKRAGLWGKGTWTKYPRQMLTARVISEGVRTVLPGVVCGIYTPEEVEDFDKPAPVEARVIEHEEAPQEEKPKREKKREPKPVPFGDWLNAAADAIPCNRYQLLNHLWKWAHGNEWLNNHPANPGEVSNRNKLALLGTLFEAERQHFKVECREYQLHLERGKLGDELGIEAVDDGADGVLLADELESTEAGVRG